MSASTIAHIETFVVTMPRDVPYIGPLGPGESINIRGYIVRKGNATIYPTVDRSVVVRVTTTDGLVGWGETYGICAPKATCEIINELLAPVLVGSDAEDVESLWEQLYGLMRVRGCTSGFHVDAISALDIALWDLRAKTRHMPLAALLRKQYQPTLPGYLSGLPLATIEQRVSMALEWQKRGITAFKFHAVISHEGIKAEFAALRAALGRSVDIMADLHWKFDAAGAIELAQELATLQPRFLEAPVATEDTKGLAQVCKSAPCPIAAGEEWYTEYEVRNRLDSCKLALIQPEMAHTGVTQFLRIAKLASQHGVAIAPHATIGTGIFLAASLHASATLSNFWKHEWQHSVFEHNLQLLSTDMWFEGDQYHLPTGIGLGVEPNERFWKHAELVQ